MADLLSVGVLLGAAAAAGWLADRLGVSPIPAYVLAGVVLSPAVAGSLPAVAGLAVEPTEFVTLGAELGIVLLLFFLGLEFDLDRLLANRARIGRAGLLDLAINFGAGLLVGLLLFDGLLAAVLVAGVVYVSSSAVVTKSLIDLGWIADPEAEPILGTLVFEDLFVAVYLAVVAAVVAGGDAATTVTSVAVALGFVVGLLVVARYAAGPLERLLDGATAEATVLRAVGLTVVVAGLALSVGVSEAVAAFFVGTAFAATRHTERLERVLESLRDLFAAVFFVWIGLGVEPAAVAAVAVPVAVAVAVTAPTKVVSGFLGGRVYGLDARRSVRVGLGLVARGEFSLIVAAVAVAGAGPDSALSTAAAETIYAFAVGYVLAASLLGTLLMGSSAPFERLADRLAARE